MSFIKELFGKSSSTTKLRKRLVHKNPIKRCQAVESTVMSKDPHAVELLTTALQDESAEVRKAAAHALGILGDPRAVMPLLKALKDEELKVWEAQEDALIRFGDTAVEAIAAMLDNLGGRYYSREQYVIHRAVGALGKFRSHSAEDVLRRALKKFPYSSEPARCFATSLMECLSFHPDRIVAILNDEKEREYVRSAAAWALRKCGDLAIEPLITTLNTSNRWLRATTAQALGALGDPRAVVALARALDDGYSESHEEAQRMGARIEDTYEVTIYPVKSAAAEALKSIYLVSRHATIELLTTALQDESAEVRKAAAHALGILGDHRTGPPHTSKCETQTGSE